MLSGFRLRITAVRGAPAQYAYALLMLVGATWMRYLLNPVLGERLPYVFYFAAVAVVSVTCDLYPTLIVLVASALLTNLLFFTPQHHFTFGRALLFGCLYLISGSVVVYAGQANRCSARALQEQKDWFHTTLTSIGDAVISTDAAGRVTLMNRVAEALTGWPLDEARGKPLAEVFRIVNQDTRQ